MSTPRERIIVYLAIAAIFLVLWSGFLTQMLYVAQGKEAPFDQLMAWVRHRI